MCATTGVLPLPPTRRLPTLMTGRAQPARRSRAARRTTAAATCDGRSRPYDARLSAPAITAPAGRADHAARPAAAARRRRPASCPSRRGWRRPARAPPRRGAPAGSVGRAVRAGRLELPLVAHLHGRAVAEERLGDLAEVLHVRAEHDRLAEDRRLEDVVPAGRHEAAADEHDRGHLVDLRQFAERVEHDDVGARVAVDRQLDRRASRNPSSRASRSTSANRSGCRGAMTSSAPGAIGRMRANARSTRAPRRCIVLPGHRPRRGRRARGRSAARGRAAGRASRRRQPQRVELQAAGHA